MNGRAFRDPHQLTYQAYVQRQAERERYVESLVDEFERRKHDANLQTEWVRLLRATHHALLIPCVFDIPIVLITTTPTKPSRPAR